MSEKFSSIEEAFATLANPASPEWGEAFGFLAGPYDTFANIQHPDKADTPLAIYDLDLYQQGGILTEKGDRMKRGNRRCGAAWGVWIAVIRDF